MSHEPFLKSVRVIEFCSASSGPFCAMLLADMGADVIKVEVPNTGDPMRAWPPQTGGYSESFASLNRNKSSVALNLNDPDDNFAARNLCATADVVIESNRPGFMRSLSLDYDTLHCENDRLIYCSISTFGQTGPRASESGFDLTIQAMTGIMSVTGVPDGHPIKCGVPISEFSTGLYAAFAITGALRGREITGEGCHIDTSMLGSSLAISTLQSSEYFATGTNPFPLGSAHPRNAPCQAFEALDGHFALGAVDNRLWKRVCNALGRDDLAADVRFSTTESRTKYQMVLERELELEFADQTVEELLNKLRGAGVPCAPVNSYSEALEDPQVEHLGLVRPLTLPNGHQTKTVVSPLRINGKPALALRPPPELGEHNGIILGSRQAASRQL